MKKERKPDSKATPFSTKGRPHRQTYIPPWAKVTMLEDVVRAGGATITDFGEGEVAL